MKIKRVEHIAIAVKDIDVVSKIFSDSLGLELECTEERLDYNLSRLKGTRRPTVLEALC